MLIAIVWFSVMVIFLAALIWYNVRNKEPVKLVYNDNKPEIQDDKMIVWLNKFGEEYHVDKMRTHKAVEQQTPKNRISKIKFIFHYLRDRKFAWLIEDTIKYALRHSESYCGEGVSEVYLLSCESAYYKIWKPYKERKHTKRSLTKWAKQNKINLKQGK
jgi:hypothetical protein